MSVLRNLATEQRKRMIASILSHCQGSEWWDELKPNEQQDLRKKVIDSANQYHDFVLDTIKASDDTLVNEQTASLLRQIRSSQARIEQRLDEIDDFEDGE